jgi:hypothetical protein
MKVAFLAWKALSETINKIFKNPMQQILVLIDECSFILKCTFQVLCYVGGVLYTLSFRHPHRKKSGTMTPDERAGNGISE